MSYENDLEAEGLSFAAALPYVGTVPRFLERELRLPPLLLFLGLTGERVRFDA